ncbi:hypothetical protein [Mesorhizobium sp. NZP2077]|uniref:hypothetical protein n=1 Tax=Mesorhizobium sp. NZP2077 TaxID=2483404 RepID=UPI0015529789|nr:hypothetical protein [Mesorhizobium sp. NZP2077]QKC85777.1 hypothetical protein EB232_33370 [Mesorhizobium sp. NZP2077]QKD19416.1 hypothetical protein HGP13_33030 [Mesorhizobium sp. NZP2077]
MQFQPLFEATDPIFKELASDHQTPAAEPLLVSPWVAMSAMQKNIRRGQIELALSAAAALLRNYPAKLWSRLAGIAFEDIGLADLDCVALVMAATTGKKFREQFGHEWRIASLVVTRMCAAPKCRGTDDLFIAISHHHELEALRGDLARETLTEHLSRVEGRAALLGASLAALHVSRVRWIGQVEGQRADPKELFAAMRVAGVGHRIVDLGEQGFRRTREALPILLPLVSQALPLGTLTVKDDEFPPVVIGHNRLPTYCLDAFSWEGKAALARFLKRDTATGRWLRKHAPTERRLSILAGGLFRVEGGLVRQRVEWPCAMTLRWLADSGFHNLKLSDPAAFLAMIRADLPKLDEVRHDVR